MEIVCDPVQIRAGAKYQVRRRVPGMKTRSGKPLYTSSVEITWYREAHGASVRMRANFSAGRTRTWGADGYSYHTRHLPEWLWKLALETRPAWADVTGWQI